MAPTTDTLAGVICIPLNSTDATIGRDPSCSVFIEGIGVSRHHAIIHCMPDLVEIEDTNSTFGLRLNDTPVSKALLNDNDILGIGILKYQIQLTDDNLYLNPIESDDDVEFHSHSDEQKSEVWIGRGDQCEMHLEHPLISRFHAVVRTGDTGALTIADNHSTNGTYVNGRAVTRTDLHNGDVIQVGPYRLYIEKGRLVRDSDYSKIKIEAFGISIRRNKQLLLDRVTLSIGPGEFVAILGASGAGKTTLAKVLTGHLHADSGEVFANGLPLRKFLGAFATNIGYVAQDTVLHPELTVAETFREQSLLRLARDSNEAERILRIKEVMTLLELEKVKKRRISQLSGGEAKRVHLGIELLASPSLIFLDEPLSGLDPGLVRRFMQLFRRICDKGHTLLLTTHTLEQIDLCDRAVFVNQGKIVFQGAPSTLPAAFGVQSLPEVYAHVSGRDSNVKNTIKATAASGNMTPPAAIPYNTSLHKRRTISTVRQIAMLVGRYTRIFCRDQRNALLVLIQTPLVATLLAFVFRPDASYLPMSFYFCLTVSSIWIGGVTSIREVAREWILAGRDIRAGMSVNAYMISKLIVFCTIGIFEGLLFWAMLTFLFLTITYDLNLLVLITIATVSGTLLGLCVSTFSGNVGRAISMLPVIFIPQIFFSGILIPFDSMTDFGRFISHLTVSRPIFSMFKQCCLLDQTLPELDGWQALFALTAGLIIFISVAIRWHFSRVSKA